MSVQPYERVPFDPDAPWLLHPKVDQALALTGQDMLAGEWTRILDYCQFVRTSVRSEISAIQRRDRLTRTMWAGLTALFGLSASSYSIIRQDDADPRVVGILSLGATGSAMPAFLAKANEERLAELIGRLAAIEGAEADLLSSSRAAAQFAAQWQGRCQSLALAGVPVAELYRVSCVLPGGYAAVEPEPERQKYTSEQQAVLDGYRSFLDGRRTVLDRLAQLQNACSR